MAPPKLVPITAVLRQAQVVRLPVAESNTALVAGVLAGVKAAQASLYDRYVLDVQRVLVRLLGPDPELADLIQEVFLVALRSIGKLRDPERVQSWLVGISVRTARTIIQKRRRKRWLSLLPPAELPELMAPTASAETSEALRASYLVLDQLPPNERIAFVLRYVEGMELKEVAESVSCSLATVKRRISRAQERFTRLAKEHGALADWIARAEDGS